MHNLRWPCGAVSLSGVTSQRHGCLLATFCTFCPCDHWPFDLILIDGRGIVMDYPCAKLAILVSVVLVLTCGQTDRITEADDRYTHATTVGVSNDLYSARIIRPLVSAFLHFCTYFPCTYVPKFHFSTPLSSLFSRTVFNLMDFLCVNYSIISKLYFAQYIIQCVSIHPN